MLLLGAGDSFDTTGFHPCDTNLANVVGLVRGLHAKLDSYGYQSRGIDVSEYGWATDGRGLPVTTSSCQAALIRATTRRLGDLRASLSLSAAVQFMRDDRPPIRDISPFNAGRVTVDGTAKPGLGAFTAVFARQPPPPGLTLEEACPPEARPTA